MAFNLTTLSEYAKVQGGFAYKSKDFIDYSENRVLKIKNVRFGTVSYEEPVYISDEIAQSTEAWATKEGDILISMTGSGPNAPQSLVGRVARVWANEPQSYINQRVGRIQLLEEGKVHPDFLFYLLSLPQSQDFLVSNSSGSANQANISGKIIGLLPCPEVTYEESESIANMVRSLDEKIILNRQTNQTLEQMAQALFKSWFVDFDPVIDNALAAGNDIPEALQHKADLRLQAKQLPDFKPLPDDISALFSSEFEQTGDPTIGLAGWIPKGWKYSELSEFMNVKHGFAYKGEYFSDEPTNDILLTPGNVAIGGGFKGDKFKFYTGPIMDDYIFTEGDLYITMTDLSKAGDTLGYPAIVPCIEGLTFHHNQRLGKVDFKDINRFGPEFLYRCLCSRNYRSYIIASATGTTVKHTSPTKILQHKVITSGGLVEPIFEQYVKHFSAKKELNNMNSIDLAKTRDVLLPKLISGEITINKEVV
ncbi:MAG: restriction endonuclease subunit S [Thiomicrorhabdus sp.]|nr:restriction endonuclease subunit S [Thiomicrorhabdus sp.]